MHIPDGFLDYKTALATAALSAGGLGLAVWRANRDLPRRRVPLMGLTAAVVFAAQMINFPVAGGTSGHLVGSVLAAVLLGAWPAVVVMTCVLALQCLAFNDGGLTALGANLFNMALAGTLAGCAVYRIVHAALPGERGRIVAAAFAAWCSTVAAALCCAAELVLSGKAPARLVFPAMTTLHMLIGLGEAVITALVLAAIARTRPELLEPTAPPRTYARFILAGLVLAIALALFAAPFASDLPDGFETVAHVLGIKPHAAPASAPMPDYKLPGISSVPLATGLAGLIGTVLAFVLAIILARLLIPRTPPATKPA